MKPINSPDQGTESFLTVRQIAEMLDISCSTVYRLIGGKHFSSLRVKNKQMIPADSFEQWYLGQAKFRKISDLSEEEQRQKLHDRMLRQMPRLALPTNQSAYSLKEIMFLLDITRKEVSELLRSGALPFFKAGDRYRVRREWVIGWLNEQKLAFEEAEQHGIDYPAGK